MQFLITINICFRLPHITKIFWVTQFSDDTLRARFRQNLVSEKYNDLMILIVKRLFTFKRHKKTYLKYKVFETFFVSR